MSIYRIKMEKNFTVFGNKMLQDCELTPAEKGVLVTLLSLPENFELNFAGIYSFFQNSIGKNSLRTIINNLKEKGYIVYEQGKNEAGRFESGVYNIFGEKQREKDKSPKENGQKVEKTGIFTAYQKIGCGKVAPEKRNKDNKEIVIENTKEDSFIESESTNNQNNKRLDLNLKKNSISTNNLSNYNKQRDNKKSHVYIQTSVFDYTKKFSGT